MTKTVVIHQPDFFPYLGFFHRFLHSDLWVILDSVQFLSGSKSWHRRDKIKSPRGATWLTVAVQKARRETKINEVFLSKEVNWRKENLNLVAENYRTAPFFNEVFPFVENLYSYKCQSLLEFNLQSIDMLMGLFNIKIETILASTLDPMGKGNELLVDLIKKVGASTYLSGVGAKAYYDPKPFDSAGIRVLWQKFNHPVYPQIYGKFIPCLSSIDLLLNCGINKSREILLGI